ncbi:hypothetical protein [Gracilibacillus boraciitolerans]|uniref:hypothetical protein n=1 Tax=Gracilibacillus boraciitolerans TaxID=307521 RepID=UPI00055087C0|nr:hypothetical protein [Gracilibacillus boraciitolerans]
MNKRASIDEITVTFFSITLVVIVLAWQTGSFPLYLLALFSLSVNLFIEAYKERKRGGNNFFFSQQLLRGISLWLIIIAAFFLL